MKIQVLLADGHPVVRTGLRRIIEETTELAVAGEAGDGHSALTLRRSCSCFEPVARGDLARDAIEHRLLDPMLE